MIFRSLLIKNKIQINLQFLLKINPIIIIKGQIQILKMVMKMVKFQIKIPIMKRKEKILIMKKKVNMK